MVSTANPLHIKIYRPYNPLLPKELIPSTQIPLSLLSLHSQPFQSSAPLPKSLAQKKQELLCNVTDKTADDLELAGSEEAQRQESLQWVQR